MAWPQLAIREYSSRVQQSCPSLTRLNGRNHHQTTVYPYNRPEREIATSDPYAIRADSKRTPSVMRSPARPNLSPTPGVPTIPCGWDRCGIPLDDCSRSGIKRHLEDFHRYDIANAQRSACKWVEDGRPCQRDFSGIATLSKHIATVHLQSCKLRCPECGMWMSRPDALTRHRQASCQKSPLDDFCR